MPSRLVGSLYDVDAANRIARARDKQWLTRISVASADSRREAAEARPGGELKPNAWDLYDMHGNVFEWCQDWHGDYDSLKVVSDPTGAAQGEYRVLRGGAFNFIPEAVRAAFRYDLPPDNRSWPLNGFRLARTNPLSP